MNGVIVGTYFKKDGVGTNGVDDARVQAFVQRYRSLVQKSYDATRSPGLRRRAPIW